MAVSTIDALYHSGSEKLTTSATGITVTGTVAATAYTGDGSALTGTGSPSIDDNGNATAITIDSSENVLVGKTSANNTDVGTTIYSTLGFSSTRSGGVVGILNRTTNDGDIVQFRKSGSTVGSIGSLNSNALYVMAPANGGCGLLFSNNAAPIYPIQNVNGTATLSDGHSDLGAAVHRFKDAYLSGGVYLGGTGAANKLDDVETGNWTPADGSGAGLSLSINAASYIKIGKFVMISFDISWPSTSTTNGSSMSGLPFTVANTGAGALSIGYDTMFTVGGANKWWIGAGSSSAYSFGRTNADMSGGRMIGSGVYITN
jgi:hypothetical protein